MLKQYQIQVNSDIYALAKLQGWFQQFQSFLPKPTWMQCNLVMVEVFTNVVSYAHEGLSEETPIDIEITIHEVGKFLEMRIWDYGGPFDLEAQIELATKEVGKTKDAIEIDDIPTGGRGLFIAKMVADDISYRQMDDGRNCFVMTKSFA